MGQDKSKKTNTCSLFFFSRKPIQRVDRWVAFTDTAFSSGLLFKVPLVGDRVGTDVGTRHYLGLRLSWDGAEESAYSDV